MYLTLHRLSFHKPCHGNDLFPAKFGNACQITIFIDFVDLTCFINSVRTILPYLKKHVKLFYFTDLEAVTQRFSINTINFRKSYKQISATKTFFS